MECTYWIYKRGNQRGPFTFAKIESMWHSGMLTDADLIRRADQQNWYTAKKIGGHLQWLRAPARAIFGNTVVIALALTVVWIFVMVWWMYS